MNLKKNYSNFNGNNNFSKSTTLKSFKPRIQSTRIKNNSPFYKLKMTVLNEENEIFPDNCLTIFDNSGKN